MISALDRQIAVELINEARTAGARLAPACKVLNISERTYQRWTKEGGVAIDQRPLADRPQPKNKLSEQERNMIIDLSTSPTYADLPPSKIVPKLADEGKYIASESTFYRVLGEEKLITHRSRAKKAKVLEPPTHIAVAPNQVWTWDITWLNASIKGEYYKLYLILDMFSRFIVGYEVWHEETAEHAKQLIRKATLAQKTANRPIILHSDNGSPMKAATFLATLEKLGVTSSFSRPRVSNDNPYSESLFKTMKYRPKYPYKGFSSLFEAREWVAEFVDWYNNDHLHSGLKFITPYQRHYNLAQDIMNKRTQTYQQAKARHPERWSGKIRDWSLPEFVYLNPMSEKEIETHINIKIPEQNHKVLTL